MNRANWTSVAMTALISCSADFRMNIASGAHLLIPGTQSEREGRGSAARFRNARRTTLSRLDRRAQVDGPYMVCHRDDTIPDDTRQLASLRDGPGAARASQGRQLAGSTEATTGFPATCLAYAFRPFAWPRHDQQHVDILV